MKILYFVFTIIKKWSNKSSLILKLLNWPSKFNVIELHKK